MTTDYKAAYALFLDKSFDNKSLLNELLQLLDTPDQMPHIAGVFENIKTALQLPLMHEVSQVDSLVEKIRSLEEVADHCHRKITAEKQHYHLRRNQNEIRVFKALNGTLKRHPLYALFYLNSTSNQNFFNWLRQILFTIKPLTSHLRPTGVHYTHRDFQQMSVAIRRLTREDHTVAAQWLLQKDCTYCLSYRDFIDFLYDYLDFFRVNSDMHKKSSEKKSVLNSNNPRDRNQYLYNEVSKVIDTINVALGYNKPRRYRVSGRGGSQIQSEVRQHGISALTGSSLIYQETSADDELLDNSLYSVLQTNFADEEIAAGEELFEQNPEEMFVFSEQEPIEHYISAFKGRRLAASTRKRIERQHQFLPTSVQLLSKQQLHRLLTACLQSQPNDYEIAKRLLMLLLCARSERDFLYAKLTKTFTDDLSAPRVLLDGSEMSAPAFCIQYETDSEALPAAPLTKVITLPLPDEVSRWLQQRFAENPQWDTFKLFTDIQYRTIEEAFEDFRLKANIPEVTPNQISNHLFWRACQKFGSATATLMFSKAAPGSQARLYYTALPVKELRARYRELIKELSHHSAVPLSYQNVQDAHIADVFLGCRYKPEAQQYKAVLSELRAKLEQRKTNMLEDTNWLMFHNEFTVYSILCQGLLTGLRPTHDGFIRFADILQSAGVAVVRDKDTSDEFHSRTIPMHPLAITLAENYHNHLKAVLGRLHRLGMLRAWQLLKSPEPFFFTNAESKKSPNTNQKLRLAITRFSPTKYSELLAPWLKLPANSHRKFIRSFLDMRRVSPEIVDAFMGHGNLGEHFWHPQSTLSFSDIRQALTPHLDELIKELDIRAVTGLQS